MRRAGNAALRLVRISYKTSAACGGSSIDHWTRFEAMSVEADAASQAAGSARGGTGGFGGGWRFRMGRSCSGPKRSALASLDQAAQAVAQEPVPSAGAHVVAGELGAQPAMGELKVGSGGSWAQQKADLGA